MTEQTVTLDKVVEISEKLSPDDQLRLVGILSQRLRGEMGQGDEPVDMLALSGLGAEIWKSIDATTADWAKSER